MDFQTIVYDLAQRYASDVLEKDQEGIELSAINQVLGWIRARDIKRLASPADYIERAYSSAQQTRFLRQIAAFFKKNAAFTSVEGERNAMLSFIEAEQLCAATNSRLNDFPLGLTKAQEGIVHKVQRIIADVLGEFADFIPEIPGRVRVTAGASSTRPRRESQPHLKLRVRKLPCTNGAQKYLKPLFAYYGYEKVSFKSVHYNRVVTVPKNWKTERTIACEPEGNLALQLALDGYIKDRLRKKLRVDLSSQFINQRFAKEASITDDVSTIDLSMASDTLSFNTLALLLPYEWFRYASDIRSPHGRGFGKTFLYSKFSSMGNGATFTLETLVFSSIVAACTDQPFAVYGDDIVVATKDLDNVLALLDYFGFLVNYEKSYFSGPFRESCGKDWFQGIDVTPFYVRCNSSMKVELCHLVNGLATISLPDGKLWEALRQIVEEHKLPLVPFNESSISGVWIDIHTAYSQSLVVYNRPGRDGARYQDLQCKAYCPTSKSMSIANLQTLSLWYFNTRMRTGERFGGGRLNENWSTIDTTSTSTSSVPFFSHKFVRKWVRWIAPPQATPAHLYRWADYLLRK